jgi:hypothetical protein
LVLKLAPILLLLAFLGLDCWQSNLGVTIVAYILAYVKVKR